MHLARYKDFDRSLNSLFKRGGLFQKAAATVQQMIGRAVIGGDLFAGMQQTHHGESRIRHCVKYDLTGRCRLITIQTDGYCILLYCGDHEDCDRWLDRNRGFVAVVDSNYVVHNTYASGRSDESTLEPSPIPGRSVGNLYLLIGDELFERLTSGIPRRVVRRLETLDAAFHENDLWTVLAEVDPSDQRTAIADVFCLLKRDAPREALERARLHVGDSLTLDQIPVDELPEIIDSDVIRRIDPHSDVYAEALRRFIASSRYRDWMLFMHPAQEAVVQEDFAGPAKLVGVSGSGKTCVVVQRAVRLARMYTGERVLVLTLNKALAHLIDQLVDTCASDEERSRIVVKPFFVMCRELLLKFEPRHEKLYDDTTWKTREHVDEIWQEFYRCDTNNYDAQVLQPVHDTLLTRGWNPETYLRDEIDWLRSALNPDDRDAYLDMERKGRSVPLTQQFRELVLEGLAGWEQKMKDIGVIDGLGIAHALARYLDRIRPQFRCVLIDEGQDFGNVELQFVRQLVAPAENDIFFCGDAAQAVTSKFQSLRQVGITIPGARSRKLSLNYRNSRDVLTAAHQVLLANLTDELMDREDFEILDPEYSAFSAATPLLLKAPDLETEIAYALKFSQALIGDRVDAKACVAICGFSLFELARFGDDIKLPVLDGRTDIESGAIFLSDLEHTKGFEFDVVCVLNCAAGVLPSTSAPESERHRDLARLYVAMTRAKTDLALSWSGEVSPFLRGLDEFFLASDWDTYSAGEIPEPVGAPIRLAERMPEMIANKTWREMSGEQFLYSTHALGLSTELIGKIRQLVDGKGLRKGREALRWRTMGAAIADYRKSGGARRAWGDGIGNELMELVSRVDSTRKTPARIAAKGPERGGSAIVL